MIRLVKLNNSGPLVIGKIIPNKMIVVVESAVSLSQEDGVTHMVDLLPFTDFEAGVTFYKTSIEFMATPTEELVAEYNIFCEDIINGTPTQEEAPLQAQLLVEGINVNPA